MEALGFSGMLGLFQPFELLPSVRPAIPRGEQSVHKAVQKNKSMPGIHHGRSGGQGSGAGWRKQRPLHHWSQTNLQLRGFSMIPRFLHPFLLLALTLINCNTPVASRIRLQVPCWPQENSRLPFFTLTRNLFSFLRLFLRKPDKDGLKTKCFCTDIYTWYIQ